MPNGEKNHGPQKLKGCCCMRERETASEEINDFVLSFFFSLGKVPAQTGRPLVDPESPRAQFVEIFYAVNAALTEGLACFTDTNVCMHF